MKTARPPYSVYDGRTRVRDFDLLRQAVEAAKSGAGSSVRHQGVVVWRASDAEGFDRGAYQRELMAKRRAAGYVEPGRRKEGEEKPPASRLERLRRYALSLATDAFEGDDDSWTRAQETIDKICAGK